MTDPLELLEPHTEIVAEAWLSLALPDVPNGHDLPPADAATREHGFVQVSVTGGGVGQETPMNFPVVTVTAWLPPADPGSRYVRWNEAHHIAQRVVRATYDPALMGRAVDLSAVGEYAPALVRTVLALSVPRRGPDDPGYFARVECDLQVNWTGV